MSQVEFIYEGSSTIIQCKPEDKISSIASKFATKSELDFNSLVFISDGQLLNKELTFAETTKSNKIIVLVSKSNEPFAVPNSKTKPKFIMCPTCNENIKINFSNYKINLFECRNGHNFNNILLNEF